MDEYINKDEIMQYLEPLTNTPAIVIKLHIKGMKAADVQPVLNIKKLQEHIKQRILETAFNNGGIYGEVAEDIASRIDIWVDDFDVIAMAIWYIFLPLIIISWLLVILYKKCEDIGGWICQKLKQ